MRVYSFNSAFNNIITKYEIEITKLSISPFVSFYYAVNNQDDVSIQIGVDFH